MRKSPPAFTHEPKNITKDRNFTALCHSTVHTSTHGTGSSYSHRANKVGVHWTIPLKDELVWSPEAVPQHTNKTIKYKTTRYFGRNKKMNSKLREFSLLSNERDNRANEHAWNKQLNLDSYITLPYGNRYCGFALRHVHVLSACK